MDSFTGKLAVVTGGGSGIGRELVRQLAAAGCSVATCDLNPDTVAVTAATAWATAPPGVAVTGHTCDVSDEAQLLRFRDELLEQHASDHVDLVFSNAGVAGGSSFVKDSREEWERTFAINWWGVYFCARTFLPLLVASGDGVLVNMSSVAGFWATAGHGVPLTAYCASEFAIKGFSEALIPDLRANAPQVRVVVVMPGQVNTDMAANSRRALGLPDVEELSDAELMEQIPEVARAILIGMGLLAEGFTADDFRQAIPRIRDEFRDQGFTAAQAATIILDGVRSGAWRILVGDEATMLDHQVRADPQAPFDYERYPEMYGPLIAQAQELRPSRVRQVDRVGMPGPAERELPATCGRHVDSGRSGSAGDGPPFNRSDRNAPDQLPRRDLEGGPE
jgi:NAD(P)-dependent dehydrogenase (short-subunit alcohol dehydrogenase family)